MFVSYTWEDDTVHLYMFVNDVKLALMAVESAEKAREMADKRLLDALEKIGQPLAIGGCVVIGDTMFARKYATLSLVLTPVKNVAEGTAVPE